MDFYMTKIGKSNEKKQMLIIFVSLNAMHYLKQKI